MGTENDTSDSVVVFFESVQAGVWDEDLVGGSTYFSQRYREILGFSAQEDMRSHVSDPERHHPEDRAGVEAALVCGIPDPTWGEIVGAHVVVGERFSVSRFWEDATRANATVAHIMPATARMLAEPERVWSPREILEYHRGRLADILAAVNSPAFGVNVDTGNFRTADPYADLARIAPYAVVTQVKTEVAPKGKKEEADLPRLTRMLRDVNYQGYVALEYEAAEDPKTAVPRYLQELKKLMG